jgi:hypothetical protein
MQMIKELWNGDGIKGSWLGLYGGRSGLGIFGVGWDGMVLIRIEDIEEMGEHERI